MICCLCGDFIRRDDERGAEVCPTCTMHYCYKCATNVDTCYVCGGNPTRIEPERITQLNTANILNEVTTIDKRGQPRKKVKIECAYTFSHKNGSGKDKKGHKALTRDISRSGLCIYSLTPLKEGQQLNFSACQALGTRSLAIVRWVKKVNGRIYLAGLKFAEK
jgi:hypothetical protein